ncbi:MAG: hypothetical protein Ct9H300mP29_6320 [Candidatus Neomarinimicrobiota bacterium]|nr:MAG: hypothetical protein Ct9H300mP29_6320 [Candidatus Neomarinimicrobiota bacterium]|tara:strand:- start:8080 stop:8943 length:864 start_codon:yes stop_codon:yes gene_type:complete
MNRYHLLPALTSLFHVIFSSCSPVAIVLEHQPEFAEKYYENKIRSIGEIIKKEPENFDLLKEGVEEFTMYAFGFLMEKADRALINNYSTGVRLQEMAHQYFVDAIDFGERGINLKYNDYQKWIAGEIGNIGLEPVNIDIALFYWTAAAYGGAVSSSQGDPEWVIKLPRVGLLLNEVMKKDSLWNNGAALVAMITYTMNNPEIAGESEKLARQYFDTAVNVSNGMDLGPYIAIAESVSKLNQNRNEFIQLLNQALDIDINSNPDLRLANIISRKRAEWLLANVDEFFY